MERPTCESCIYWDELETNGETGECHRHAPAKESVDLWPRTRYDDWCGEADRFITWMLDQKGPKCDTQTSQAATVTGPAKTVQSGHAGSKGIQQRANGED